MRDQPRPDHRNRANHLNGEPGALTVPRLPDLDGRDLPINHDSSTCGVGERPLAGPCFGTPTWPVLT
jgi:hypothetical protein